MVASKSQLFVSSNSPAGLASNQIPGANRPFGRGYNSPSLCVLLTIGSMNQNYQVPAEVALMGQ
jgi:hypothetical protein